MIIGLYQLFQKQPLIHITCAAPISIFTSLNIYIYILAALHIS